MRRTLTYLAGALVLAAGFAWMALSPGTPGKQAGTPAQVESSQDAAAYEVVLRGDAEAARAWIVANDPSQHVGEGFSQIITSSEGNAVMGRLLSAGVEVGEIAYLFRPHGPDETVLTVRVSQTAGRFADVGRRASMAREIAAYVARAFRNEE